MIIIIANSYGRYMEYVKTTIAQSHAMSEKDFTCVCSRKDVNKVISIVANEIRIIDNIVYLTDVDWFNLNRRIR